MLDVGCGEGGCLSAAYHGAAQVVGIDLAEQDLATAQKRQHDFESGHGPLSPITFMKGSARSISRLRMAASTAYSAPKCLSTFPLRNRDCRDRSGRSPRRLGRPQRPRAWPENLLGPFRRLSRSPRRPHPDLRGPALQRRRRARALRGTLRRPCVTRTLLVAALPLWWGRRRHRSLARAPLAQAFAVGPSKGPGPHPNARALAESVLGKSVIYHPQPTP